jgi:hypothetical protein
VAQITITLDGDLLVTANAEAARAGWTLSQLVSDVLREMLARRDAAEERSTVRLPVHPGGLHPGVDLDNNAVLRDYLDEIGDKSWP